MVCRGICSTMETKKFTGGFILLYIEEGYRGCRECDCMIKFSGTYCPCCGMKTTITPRRSKTMIKVYI